MLCPDSRFSNSCVNRPTNPERKVRARCQGLRGSDDLIFPLIEDDRVCVGAAGIDTKQVCHFVPFPSGASDGREYPLRAHPADKYARRIGIAPDERREDRSVTNAQTADTMHTQIGIDNGKEIEVLSGLVATDQVVAEPRGLAAQPEVTVEVEKTTPPK